MATASQKTHAHIGMSPRSVRAADRREARAAARSPPVLLLFRWRSSFARLLAEQALRAEDHDHHEDREHDDRRPRRAVVDRDSTVCWMIPMIRPPTTAPLRLPMPPMTAAVKAIRPAVKPWLNWTVRL
jgi:hypothetical protein